MTKIKIAMAQLNTVVGALDYNLEKINDAIFTADQKDADLIIMPETALTSYPCEDLLLKHSFINETEKRIWKIVELSKKVSTAILLTTPTIEEYKSQKLIRNSAMLIEKGEIKKIINKKSLPNYGVFDENRYFQPANTLSTIEFRGFTHSILICEDLWNLKNLFMLQEQIIDNIIVVNSSPFTKNKHQKRITIAKNFATSLCKPLLYINQIGGQDNLVFDGNSFAIDENGNQILQMLDFEEDFKIIELEKKQNKITNSTQQNTNQTKIINIFDSNNKNINITESINCIFIENQENINESIYQALVLGLKDYVTKNNFKTVLLGMSGGIDSAMVATIAVDALGSENVKLYALPSRYNSQESMDDALLCAKNLDLKLNVINIEKTFTAIIESLGNEIDQSPENKTLENIQSRIRGNLLMSLANEQNSLLLTTSNKSELATGYGTIYGDMCGAFNVLKDLYKTTVYELALFRNKKKCRIGLCKKTSIIPESIIKKEPSAELRENQKDSDSLPDYKILDKILELLIEESFSINQIVNKGFENEMVKKVAKLLLISEYKRKQSPIGVKISEMSFDKDRRYPLTNKFFF